MNEVNQKSYSQSLEEEFGTSELPDLYPKSNNEKKTEKPENQNVIIREIHYVPLIKRPKQEEKGGILPLILILVFLAACARYHERTGNDFIYQVVSNRLLNKQNINETGKINDRVYLSPDMTKVTIRYDNGKKTKTFDFSENARYYYKQIRKYNTFGSKDKNRVAFLISLLMMYDMPDQNIVYKLGGGSDQYNIDISTYNDCARYVGDALWYATGITLPNSNNKIFRTVTGTILSENNGKRISPENCRPGDCKLKNTIPSGGNNHVVVDIGKVEYEGKLQDCIIECSSTKGGVTIRPNTNYPIAVRLNCIENNTVLLSENVEQTTLYNFDTNEVLICKKDIGGEEK